MAKPQSGLQGTKRLVYTACREGSQDSPGDWYGQEAQDQGQVTLRVQRCLLTHHSPADITRVLPLQNSWPHVPVSSPASLVTFCPGFTGAPGGRGCLSNFSASCKHASGTEESGQGPAWGPLPALTLAPA